MSDAKLNLQSVGIVLDSKVILDDVNLKIDTGEIVSLIVSQFLSTQNLKILNHSLPKFC